MCAEAEARPGVTGVTRSGRAVRAPRRFSPKEKPTDDYAVSEHDTDDDNSDTDDSRSSESSSDDDSFVTDNSCESVVDESFVADEEDSADSEDSGESFDSDECCEDSSDDDEATPDVKML
jgi:hypothetical protein